MLVAWRYRDRGTFLYRLDPRARLLFILGVMLATYPIWDLRIVLVFLALALGQYVLARIPFRYTRRFWFVIGLFAVVLSLLTLISRGRLTGYVTTEHMLFAWTWHLGPWTLHPALSAEQLMFLVTQLTRIFVFALLAVVIPYTFPPHLYGVTFHGLGFSDSVAFAMDLAFRLVPTVGRDFQIIVDAQRARGYELERVRGGLIGRIRRLAPLMVPLVVGALLSGEEMIDAMELRAFGTGPRTWLYELRYRPADYALLVLTAGIVVAAFAVAFLGYGRLWVPAWLLRLATGG